MTKIYMQGDIHLSASMTLTSDVEADSITLIPGGSIIFNGFQLTAGRLDTGDGLFLGFVGTGKDSDRIEYTAPIFPRLRLQFSKDPNPPASPPPSGVGLMYGANWWDPNPSETPKESEKLSCLEHSWVDTGTRKTWCKVCDQEGDRDFSSGTVTLIFKEKQNETKE